MYLLWCTSWLGILQNFSGIPENDRKVLHLDYFRLKRGINGCKNVPVCTSLKSTPLQTGTKLRSNQLESLICILLNENSNYSRTWKFLFSQISEPSQPINPVLVLYLHTPPLFPGVATLWRARVWPTTGKILFLTATQYTPSCRFSKARRLQTGTPS